MKESEFTIKNQKEWREYDQIVTSIESGNYDHVDTAKVPKLFRKRCAELALARHRMYSSRACEDMNDRVTRGHKLVARSEGGFKEKIVSFYTTTFPRAMRQEWRLHIVCWLFFLLPFFGMWLSYGHDQEWVHSMLGDETRRNMDEWYGKGSTGSMREEFGSNFMMFGFYVNNNIGIDLLTVAGGALAGVGSLFLIFSNGLAMGASLTYVLYEGSPERLLSFVSGHAPYELLGMIVSGMAGMRIGLAMIKPGQMSRARALLESGKRGLPLIIGACSLTFFAAIIEGFWSGEIIDAQIKYWVGYVGWFLLFIYIAFAGRRAEA